MQKVPHETNEFSLCASQNQRYVFISGGKTETGIPKKETTLNTVARLDLKTNTWEELPLMN